MVRMFDIKRFWLMLLLLCAGFATTPALASLQASVDRNPVSMNESFTLTLESNDNLDGTPDLSVLQQDFEVLNQGKSSSFQFINGNSSRSVQWSITLMPKHSGNIQIPPISIGGEQSAPISLTVTTAAAPTQGSAHSGKLFMEVSVSPQTVYVQQQVVYTVRLFHSVNFANNASLTEPKLADDDAIVEKLGNDKNYQTTRNGIRYAVVERNYAIYPQHSGNLEIPPLVFDGDIVQASASNFFNFDPFSTSTRHQRVVSAPASINVQAAPVSFNGKQWLPARNLQVVEQWSPDPPSFTVGQPITRTVAVMADGLTATQLPPLADGAIDDMKQYPNQPSLKDTKASNGITGIRSEKIAMIPKHPGTVTLPAISIPWWNTTTNTEEVATLPARTVTVAPASGSTASAPPTVPSTAVTSAPKTPIPSPIASEPTPTRQTVLSSSSPGFWPWLSLFLALGWFSTLLAWWWVRRRASTTPPPKEDKESLRQLEKRIKEKCLANDAHGCSRALLHWARQIWPQHPPVSLIALAQRCPPALAEQLQTLDRTLYAPDTSPWQGAQLWQQFSNNKPKNHKTESDQSMGLRPLYGD